MILSRFLIRLLSTIFIGLIPASAIAQDENLSVGQAQPGAVLELFTSQGCSSCPPADRLLTELSAREDMVALSYHVDYWDYIGWADTLASPAYTALQRDYARSWGSTRLYTPQIVVNGRKGLVGSHRAQVLEALTEKQLSLSVHLSAQADMLEISAPALISTSDGMANNAVVWLAPFIKSAEVKIDRGENRGKTMTYSHVVTERRAIGMWEAGIGVSLKMPLSEVLGEKSDGAAVLIQAQKAGLPGPILGAALFIP